MVWHSPVLGLGGGSALDVVLPSLVALVQVEEQGQDEGQQEDNEANGDDDAEHVGLNEAEEGAPCPRAGASGTGSQPGSWGHAQLAGIGAAPCRAMGHWG